MNENTWLSRHTLTQARGKDKVLDIKRHSLTLISVYDKEVSPIIGK